MNDMPIILASAGVGFIIGMVIGPCLLLWFLMNDLHQQEKAADKRLKQSHIWDKNKAP